MHSPAIRKQPCTPVQSRDKLNGKTSFAEKALITRWTSRCSWGTNVSLWKIAPTTSWAGLWETIASRLRERILRLCSSLVRDSWSMGFNSVLTSRSKTWTYNGASRKELRRLTWKIFFIWGKEERVWFIQSGEGSEDWGSDGCVIYIQNLTACVDPALSSEVMSDVLQRLPLTTAIPLNRVGIVFPLLCKNIFFLMVLAIQKSLKYFLFVIILEIN